MFVREGIMYYSTVYFVRVLCSMYLKVDLDILRDTTIGLRPKKLFRNENVQLRFHIDDGRASCISRERTISSPHPPMSRTGSRCTFFPFQNAKNIDPRDESNSRILFNIHPRPSPPKSTVPPLSPQT